MRLTLRTLLAYLDDTLDPAETKAIGTKVAESAVAAELVERIRRVTRRRGLTTPSVAGDNPTSDPNAVAEYLDSTLAAEEVAELERLALESDSHLAEIAACHQILALALSEPASVPPIAHQRMYRVVKGREAIPFRKPTRVLSAGIRELEVADAGESEYDIAIPALSSDRPRWGLLTGVAAGFLALAGLAISMGIAPKEESRPLAYPVADGFAQTELPKEKPQEKPRAEVVAAKPVEPKPAEVVKPVEIAKKEEPIPAPVTPTPAAVPPKVAEVPMPPARPNKPVPEVVAANPEVPAPPASEVRQPIGAVVPTGQMLVAKAPPIRPERVPREDVWHRIGKGNPPVQTADRLVAPPGYHPEILLDSGIHLQLWANLPDFVNLPLLETRVRTHAPAAGFDADITLDAGRLYIRNDKPAGPARVRVRLQAETWELALAEPKAEVCLDRFDHYAPGVQFSPMPGGEAPRTECNLALLAGRCGVRLGFKDFPNLDSPTYFTWDNKGSGLQGPMKTPEQLQPLWNRTTTSKVPGSADTAAGLADLERRFTSGSESIDIDWSSVWKAEVERPSRRIVALFGLEAVDSTTDLIDALGDDFPPLRQAAIIALRQWSGGAPERDLELMAVLVKQRRFQEVHAEIILDLLHTYSPAEIANAATCDRLFNYLKHERLQIRELAFWHLVRLDPQGAREANYTDANGPDAAREAAAAKWYNSWKKRFDAKKAKK